MNEEVLVKLLKFGVDHGASDIHLEVGAPPCYRINGELHHARYDKLNCSATLSAAQILLGTDRIDFSQPFPEQDTSYSIAGVGRFRVSLFRQRGSVGCVLRAIPYKIPSMEELGLPPVLNALAEERRGLILVTGATGMGKTTTIASLIQLINESRSCHVITIEDPIEYLFSSRKALVIQREVGTDTRSFSDALIAALRQDPDVIMLGEIRDAGTANICLKAAETGHLVISTLHTPDVQSTLKRLVGLFEQQDAAEQIGRLADSVAAIVSIRLLPRADGSGLVPAVEVMFATETIRACIREPKRRAEIREQIMRGRELYRMQTFDQHLADLVRNGRVTLQAAKAAATRPEELERSLMVD